MKEIGVGFVLSTIKKTFKFEVLLIFAILSNSPVPFSHWATLSKQLGKVHRPGSFL